jgi:hypothetical protein
MRRFIALLLLCLSVLPGVARAVLVEDLYRVELPVEDQTTAKRLEAFNNAFRLLLIKISGSAQAFDNPGLKRPLSNSSRYVLQFRYVMRQQPSEVADEPPIDVLNLTVTFNRDLVESLLRENGVPLWGRERPSSLMLVHYSQHNDAGVLVSGDTVAGLVEEFDAEARRKGLPILFPLLDLEDRGILGGAIDLLPNADRMDELAQRYGPDVILSGVVIASSDVSWQARWQARFSNKSFNWSNQAASRKQLIDQSLTELARILASEYALKSIQANDQDVLFKVDEVRDVREYIKVLNYLQSLDAVDEAGPVRIEGQQATYRVRLRNSAEDLHRLISLGYVLEQLELPQINAAEERQLVRLNYRLIH